jgi:hypothetical protein
MKKMLLMLAAVAFSIPTLVKTESMRDVIRVMTAIDIKSERESACHKYLKIFREILEDWIVKKQADENHDIAVLGYNLRQYRNDYFSYLSELNCNEFASVRATEKDFAQLFEKVFLLEAKSHSSHK